MDNWLRTWQWGWVRIVADEDTTFASWIRDDDLGEWSYYWLNGEVVAVHNWEDEEGIENAY